METSIAEVPQAEAKAEKPSATQEASAPSSKAIAEGQGLTDREQDRLDSLLQAARTFHYLNFAIAALSLEFFSRESPAEIKLPFGDITLPTVHAAVAGYVLTIALAIASDRLFRMAIPWI